MNNQRKLIVGFDLCDDFSQISCYSYKTFEPIPICPYEEDENTKIPTALCVKNESRTWVYGKEALDCAKHGEGLLVDNLLLKLKLKEEVEILGQSYSPVSLIKKYIRKTLTLVKNHFPTETITQIVITLHEMDPQIIQGIYEALSNLGIDKDRANIISHGSSFMYYALSQDRELWLNDVGMFDFSEHGLDFYQISINRRSNPIIAGLEKRSFSDTLNYSMINNKNLDLGYTFENIANTVLYKQIISTLYFTGRGFEGEWSEEVIKSLCAGRRVFKGPNLYTRGACFAAKELSGEEKLSNIILLNNDMIVNAIYIKAYVDGDIKEVLVTDPAVPWYEVDKEIELIPYGVSEMEIVFRNILTKKTIIQRIPLQDFPERPERMTRLNINIACIGKSKVKLTITDMGFGDIYKSKGRLAEYFLDM